MHRWLDLGFGIGLRPPSLESSLLLDRGEKQEESHSSAVHSSGHIPLTTQRAHFEGDILCAVWQAEQAKKIYCGCVSIQDHSGRCPWLYWQSALIYCSWEMPSGRI